MRFPAFLCGHKHHWLLSVCEQVLRFHLLFPVSDPDRKFNFANQGKAELGGKGTCILQTRSVFYGVYAQEAFQLRILSVPCVSDGIRT